MKKNGERLPRNGSEPRGKTDRPLCSVVHCAALWPAASKCVRKLTLASVVCLPLGRLFILTGSVALIAALFARIIKNWRTPMKIQHMKSVCSAVRSGPLTDKDTSLSSLSACGLLLSVGMLAGCTEPVPNVAVSEPDPELVFVRGYRSADDDCKLTGESAFTVEFLDDAADLVTCSTGSAAATTLVSETSASMLTQTNSYTLYSVPRR